MDTATIALQLLSLFALGFGFVAAWGYITLRDRLNSKRLRQLEEERDFTNTSPATA